MPVVSIITPCYNSARYIRETVASILTQTLCDWEMVIVDDDSTDDPTGAIADYLSEEPRLCFIRKPNGGVASARNVGFRAINPESKYVIFLDADDCLESTALAELTHYLDSHPEAGMVYCDPMLIGDDSRELCDESGKIVWNSERWIPTRFWLRPVPPEVPQTSLHSVFAMTTIIPSMSLIRYSIYTQTAGFDEDFGHLCEDTDVFIQVGLRSEIHHYPKQLLRYRQHPMQSTSNADKIRHQEQKLFRKWQHNLAHVLTGQDAKAVEAALRFREGRLIPRVGLEAAKRHLREGRMIDAGRFLFGALRRYSLSL